MTHIAAPIMLGDPATARRIAGEALAMGADLIEWRMDMAEAAAIQQIFSDPIVRGAPWILTIRPTWEGGKFGGDESARLDLFRTCLQYHPRYIDIELEAWERDPRFAQFYCRLETNRRPKLILSSHHFDKKPADTAGILARIARHPEVNVAKIAFQAADLADAIEALELYAPLKHYPGLSGVFLAMGDFGVISRTLAGKFGAEFTFGIVPGNAPTAAGQPSIRDLKDVFAMQLQQKSWQVCGLVGWPVAQSVGPHMHNAAMRAIDFPGVYVRLPLAGDYGSLAHILDRLRNSAAMNICGVSVTIPHKENAHRFVRQRGGRIDGVDIGAINTILFPPHAPPIGFNTDAPGALAAILRGAALSDEELRGRRAAIIGAGGAARGIASILASRQCAVDLYNRTPQRAAELIHDLAAHGFHCNAFALSELGAHPFDMLIQCTPVGMHPHIDAMPIAEDTPIAPGTIVMDTIYNPRITKLLSWASRRGAVCVPGLEMLIEQGALQFSRFTGHSPPLGIMREAAEKALS